MTIEDRQMFAQNQVEYQKTQDRFLNVGNASSVGFRKGETYYKPVAAEKDEQELRSKSIIYFKKE